MVYGPKDNSKLSKACKMCNEYQRKEGEKRKEVNLKMNET